VAKILIKSKANTAIGGKCIRNANTFGRRAVKNSKFGRMEGPRYSISGWAHTYSEHITGAGGGLSVISVHAHKSRATRFYCRRKMSTRSKRARVHRPVLFGSTHIYTRRTHTDRYTHQPLKGSIRVKARCQTFVAICAVRGPKLILSPMNSLCSVDPVSLSLCGWQ
jgi:hypothetical protein